MNLIRLAVLGGELLATTTATARPIPAQARSQEVFSIGDGKTMVFPAEYGKMLPTENAKVKIEYAKLDLLPSKDEGKSYVQFWLFGITSKSKAKIEPKKTLPGSCSKPVPTWHAWVMRALRFVHMQYRRIGRECRPGSMHTDIDGERP